MNTSAQIEKIVDQLELIPHPEGGFYKEVYRSSGVLPKAALGAAFSGDRNYCTSIYFLLTSANFSAFHRIQQDEVWHFYAGSPLTVHVIDAEGNYSANLVGNLLTDGIQPQFVVPAGCWFASSVESENSFALVGCTVAPGFDFADFELAQRADLVAEFPAHKNIIERLTRLL